MDDDSGLVERYLEHVRVEKRLAQRTLELYALDLQKLSEQAQKAGVPLLQVPNAQSGAGADAGAGRSGRASRYPFRLARLHRLGREARQSKPGAGRARAPRRPSPAQGVVSTTRCVRRLQRREATLAGSAMGTSYRFTDAAAGGRTVGLDVQPAARPGAGSTSRP